jgi:segregation and condensation protein A
MSHQVHTPVFDGPLDLLLDLITSRRVDVTELSLTDIVNGYLAALEEMRSLDLEVTSEFLVIAATLIQLKARRLLPEDLPVDLDEELALAGERDRLLSRLLANLTFKDVAAVLAHRLDTADLLVPRLAGLDRDVVPPPPDVRIGVSAGDLALVAERVFSRASGRVDLDHLDLDLPSVGDAIADVRRRIADELEADFEALVADRHSPLHVIAYFLAVLELARWGMLQVRQAEPGAAITITRSDGRQPADLVSEWDTVA